MGLLLDGEPVGAPASEAPPLRQTLQECAALLARPRPREVQGTPGFDSSQAARSLRAIDRQPGHVVQEPVPAAQRSRIWDLRAPKTKTPG